VLDFLAYALFIVLAIGCLRFVMRDLPSEEIGPRKSTSSDEASSER
jgi:hypothetical protein